MDLFVFNRSGDLEGERPGAPTGVPLPVGAARLEQVLDALENLRQARDGVASELSPRARVHIDLAIDALHRDYQQRVLEDR